MSRKIRILLTLGGLIVIVLIVAGYLALTHHQKLNSLSSAYKSAPPIVPYTANHSYIYKNLDTYSLKSSHLGSNLSFSKPVELKLFGQAGGTDTNDQVLLIHLPPDHTNPDFSRIAAALSYSEQAFTPDMLAIVNNSTKTGSSTYQNFFSTEQSFVTRRLPYGFDKISLSAPQAFSSANLTANAWLSSFTAASSKLKNAPEIKGEVIEAYGKQTVYYFMVDNIASDWTANQAVWQEVINSLKIDQ